jgi:exopolysaccharide biosynthesis polyprenyl glycosylphosphotransferase
MLRRGTPGVEHDALITERLASNRVIASRDRMYRRGLAIADIASTLLALAVCTSVLGSDLLTPMVLVAAPLVAFAGKTCGLYDRDELLIRKTTMEEAPKLFQLATLYTLGFWLLSDVFLNGTLGRTQALVLWLSLWGFVFIGRRVARTIIRGLVPVERCLMIGDAEPHARLREKFLQDNVKAELVGRMSLQRVSRSSGDERPIDEGTLRQLAADLDVHRVIVVPSQRSPQVTLDVIRAAKGLGLRVSLVPQVLEVVGNSVVFDEIGGMTLMGVRSFGLSRSSAVVKRAFDFVGAMIGLIAIAPVMSALALAVKLDSPGPVLFRQTRVGRAGRRFEICKFRTMCADAEDRKAELMARNEADGLFKIADDPRITRVGRFLRRTSLDELPQLFNVLRGEMSLVGPRPLILSEDSSITGHDRRRLHLTPGMTGHWQIMGSSRVPLGEMVKIDYLYAAGWSLWDDIMILARTVPYMLSRRGM